MKECLFYSKKEVAGLLGKSEMTVDRMRHRGEIPGVVKVSGGVSFHKATFHKWLNKKLVSVSQGVD